MHDGLAERATGRWFGLLSSLGVSPKYLGGRHCPCPACGGKDRFRWDNRDGRGTFICSQCGAGDGFSLLMKVRGWDFSTAKSEVGKIVDGISKTEPRRELSDERIRQMKRDLYRASVPVAANDKVDLYLRARGIALGAFPAALRTVTDDDVMLAMVHDVNSEPASMHRTWLGTRQRKAMPGPLPKGGAIRLSPPAETLGIAEGIETALAAGLLHDCPCWSAINSTMLEQWEPPSQTRAVIVFGDCDPKFGGQKSAYALAHRLAVRGLRVDVRIPEAGDWNDVLQSGATA